MSTTACHCGPYTEPNKKRPHPHTLLFKTNFKIILLFKYRSPKLPLAFCFSNSTYVHVSHLFHMWGIPHPHHSDFCHPNKICQRLQIIKAHYDISLFSCYVISHTNIHLSTLFSIIFSLRSSITVKQPSFTPK
jgi:hypothetical protein